MEKLTDYEKTLNLEIVEMKIKAIYDREESPIKDDDNECGFFLIEEFPDLRDGARLWETESELEQKALTEITLKEDHHLRFWGYRQRIEGSKKRFFALFSEEGNI